MPAPTPSGTASLRRAGRAVAAAVSLVLLIVSGFAWASYRNFTNDVAHGAAVPSLAPGGHDVDGKDTNILLIGNDSRAGATPEELRALHTGNDGGSVNTDTMILLHIPANGAKPTMVSFPRDSWVDIPGHGKGKINSAYGDGYTAARNAHRSETEAESAGIQMTIKAISALTGLHIDHYVQVNLLGFYRISNAIGGVPVCLVKAQNANTDSDQYGRGYSGIDLPAGESVIKGTQALAFVRQRHGLPRGDLDRVRRQQYFLASALHKVASAGTLLNPFKLHDMLKAVGSSLLTDPDLDLLTLARQFENIAGGGVNVATIPNNGPQLIYPDGIETSIVAVDTAAMPDFIRTLQGKPADPGLAGAKAADPGSVTVDVLNGTQTAGLAGRNADALKARGFNVNAVDSAQNETSATLIQYPPGAQSAAKAVAAVAPGAKLVETSTVKRVTLVLGSDGLDVGGTGRTGGAGAGGAPAAGGGGQHTAPAPAPSGSKGGPGGLGCIN